LIRHRRRPTGIIIFQNGRCFPLATTCIDYLIFRLIKEALFLEPKRLSQSNQEKSQGKATGTVTVPAEIYQEHAFTVVRWKIVIKNNRFIAEMEACFSKVYHPKQNYLYIA
jgi:hypothetical protein